MGTKKSEEPKPPMVPSISANNDRKINKGKCSNAFN